MTESSFRLTSSSSPPSLFARLYDPLTELPERYLLRHYREELTRDLHGTVLDIGIGTGRMIPFYAQHPTDTRYIGIDPDPAMLKQAHRRARNHDVPITLTRGVVESLPVPTDSVTTVISTFVLCSVHDLQQALDEINRILTPTGELRFIEHVQATGLRRTLQSSLTPLWRRIAGGCHLDRDTVTRIRSSGHYEELTLETLGIGITPIKPIVRGTYRPTG